MSTAGTIKRRTLLTGTDDPLYQASKDWANDSLIVASAVADHAVMVRDSTQTDGWGFLTLGAGLSVVGGVLSASGGAAVAGADTQVIFNDAGAYAGDAGLTYNKTTDTLTAGIFAGSGASLTALSATALASGTIPDARFPATLPAISGANLTNLPSAVIGATTQIAFNDTGTMAGDAGLTYNKTTDVLTVTGAVSIGTTVAATGEMRIGTNFAMRSRNTTNLADFFVIGVDSSNQINLANNGNTILTYGPFQPDTTVTGTLDLGTSTATWRTGYFGTSVFSPILYGSSAANGDLIIEGTSHATKTTSDVAIQPSGGTISTGGTACVASFGPAVVASITIKNGLVVAIS